VPYTFSTGPLKGCLSCKGQSSGTANDVADKNIHSCTAPTSVADYATLGTSTKPTAI